MNGGPCAVCGRLWVGLRPGTACPWCVDERERRLGRVHVRLWLRVGLAALAAVAVTAALIAAACAREAGLAATQRGARLPCGARCEAAADVGAGGGSRPLPFPAEGARNQPTRPEPAPGRPGGPSPVLWRAQVQEESTGDPLAYKADEDAAGIVQIRPCVPADLRRLGLLEGPVDRFDPAESRHVWDLYLRHYGARYRRVVGRGPTDEVYARIWNGGPEGWRRASTLPYWRKVRAAMRGGTAAAG